MLFAEVDDPNAELGGKDTKDNYCNQRKVYLRQDKPSKFLQILAQLLVVVTT